MVINMINNSKFIKKEKPSFKEFRTICLQNNLNLTFYNYRDFPPYSQSKLFF